MIWMGPRRRVNNVEVLKNALPAGVLNDDLNQPFMSKIPKNPL